MAGSITNLGYIADNEEVYQVRVDKSNAAGQGFLTVNTTNVAQAKIPPKFFKMREVRIQCNAEPKIIRTIPIGSINAYNAIVTAGFVNIQRYPDMTAERFNLLDAKGERRKSPRLTTPDTGLTDTIVLPPG